VLKAEFDKLFFLPYTTLISPWGRLNYKKHPYLKNQRDVYLHVILNKNVQFNFPPNYKISKPKKFLLPSEKAKTKAKTKKIKLDSESLVLENQ
jgi:hypothetical protein